MYTVLGISTMLLTANGKHDYNGNIHCVLLSRLSLVGAYRTENLLLVTPKRRFVLKTEFQITIIIIIM